MDGFSMNMPSANDMSGLDFGSQTLNFLKLKQKKRKLFSELACIELYHLTWWNRWILLATLKMQYGLSHH